MYPERKSEIRVKMELARHQDSISIILIFTPKRSWIKELAFSLITEAGKNGAGRYK